MDHIEQRLERLEGQARLFRNLFLLAGVALVALVSYGATNPLPIVTHSRKFEVVNEEGTPMVTINADEKGGKIRIWNNQGRQVTIALGHNELGDGLISVNSSSGKPGTELHGGIQDKTGGLFIGFNSTGGEAVQIHADEQGNGIVGVFNRQGNGRVLRPLRLLPEDDKKTAPKRKFQKSQ